MPQAEIDSFKKKQTTSFISSIIYHDIFNYPLTKKDLERWMAGDEVKDIKSESNNVIHKKEYFYLEGRESGVLKRIMNEKTSQKKLVDAQHYSDILKKVPSIKMLALTGSLAMNNASEESDIDFMVVTAGKTLWATRLITYFLIKLLRMPVRKPNFKHERDRLCLNLWLDETDLSVPLKMRNIYSAHEVAQIKPLVNKNSTYELFINNNDWIKNYWPNATEIIKLQSYKINRPLVNQLFINLLILLEPFAFIIQKIYMRSKITRETITKTQAFFHPFDWSKIILHKLTTS